MHPSFGEVEFLAGSPNRIEVLEAVTGEPRTRDELKARTGLSRVALSRALSDLEDRDWLVRTGHHYAPTPLRWASSRSATPRRSRPGSWSPSPRSGSGMERVALTAGRGGSSPWRGWRASWA